MNADSSAGIIAGTAKYSEKRILIHTLTGVEVVTNENTWSLPHPPRHKVSVLSYSASHADELMSLMTCRVTREEKRILQFSTSLPSECRCRQRLDPTTWKADVDIYAYRRVYRFCAVSGDINCAVDTTCWRDCSLLSWSYG